MNRRAMTNPVSPAPIPASLRLAAAACALALGACGGSSSQPALQGTALQGTPIGGDFTLHDKAGKTVRWGDFAGRYRIVYFGYTFCPDACPLDVGVTMHGLAQFARSHPERAGRIAALFITIDPARDTPARVGEFAAAFGPELTGLTGSAAEVDRAVKAFKVYAARGKDTPGGYLMDHSRFAYLMDPAGQPIEALPTDKGAAAVAADLDRAVR